MNKYLIISDSSFDDDDEDCGIVIFADHFYILGDQNLLYFVERKSEKDIEIVATFKDWSFVKKIVG